MKAVLFVGLFAMLGAGLVTMTYLAMGSAPTAASHEAAAPAEDLAAPMRGELADVTRQLADLSMRLTTLEARVQSGGGAASARVDPDGVQAAELEELRSLLAAIRDPEVGSEQLQDVVLEVIDAKEQRDREERAERRAEQAEERMEARIADLTEKLGLDSYQASEMKRILTDESTSRDAFFTKMREEESWDRTAMREGMTEIRDKSLGELERVLLPGQYTQYVEQESRGFGGGFGGGGGRGGDRGGGNQGGQGGGGF